MFGSFIRYVQCCGFIALFELVEMDAFFLKSTLWLEPPVCLLLLYYCSSTF